MIPNILNRRFAIVTGLAILGAVAFMPKASAVDQTVEFTGSITGLCVFTLNNNGTLTETAGRDGFTTNAAGSVDLACNNVGSTLAVAAPNLTSGQTLATPTYTYDVISTTLTAGTLDETTAAAVIINVFDEELTVEMTLDTLAVLDVGAYAFDVVLTALPN
jgi:hypothetical protein